MCFSSGAPSFCSYLLFVFLWLLSIGSSFSPSFSFFVICLILILLILFMFTFAFVLYLLTFLLPFCRFLSFQIGFSLLLLLRLPLLLSFLCSPDPLVPPNLSIFVLLRASFLSTTSPPSHRFPFLLSFSFSFFLVPQRKRTLLSSHPTLPLPFLKLSRSLFNYLSLSLAVVPVSIFFLCLHVRFLFFSFCKISSLSLFPFSSTSSSS